MVPCIVGLEVLRSYLERRITQRYAPRDLTLRHNPLVPLIPQCMVQLYLNPWSKKPCNTFKVAFT